MLANQIGIHRESGQQFLTSWWILNRMLGLIIYVPKLYHQAMCKVHFQFRRGSFPSPWNSTSGPGISDLRVSGCLQIGGSQCPGRNACSLCRTTIHTVRTTFDRLTCFAVLGWSIILCWLYSPLRQAQGFEFCWLHSAWLLETGWVFHKRHAFCNRMRCSMTRQTTSLSHLILGSVITLNRPSDKDFC